MFYNWSIDYCMWSDMDIDPSCLQNESVVANIEHDLYKYFVS